MQLRQKTLSDEITALKNRAIQIATQISAGKQDNAIKNYLAKANGMDLFFYAQNDTVNNFLLKNVDFFNEIWKEKLSGTVKDPKAVPVPSWQLHAVEGNDSVTVMDLFMGYSLYKAYVGSLDAGADRSKEAEYENPDYWLDLACKKKFFYALKERCDLNKKNLNDDKFKAEEKSKMAQILLADLASLGQFYLSTGYLEAATVSFNISINQPNNQDKIQEQKGQSSQSFSSLAVGSFFCAKEFADLKIKDPQLKNPRLKDDKELIDLLTKGQGLSVFSTALGDMVEIEKKLLELDGASQEQKVAQDKVDQFVGLTKK
jgi:hypothetical protein